MLPICYYYTIVKTKFANAMYLHLDDDKRCSVSGLVDEILELSMTLCVLVL